MKAATVGAALDPDGDLIAVARALFEPRTHATVTSLVRQPIALPAKMGRRTMRALRDALAKGLVLAIARAGARVASRFDGKGNVSIGRVWERAEPFPLHLSVASFELLHWLLTTKMTMPTPPALPGFSAEPTLADELVMVFVVDLMDAAGVGAVARAQTMLKRSPLVWLFVGGALPGQVPSAKAIARWTAGAGADVALAFAPTIAERFLAVERLKAKETDPVPLVAVGQAQTTLLDRFVDGAIEHARIDAATFLRVLLARLDPPQAHGRALDPTSSLSARVDARRGAVAPLRAMGRIAAYRERFRHVGYVDDGYDEAQRVLRAFEPWDPAPWERAAEIVRATETLDVVQEPR